MKNRENREENAAVLRMKRMIVEKKKRKIQKMYRGTQVLSRYNGIKPEEG